MFSEFCESFYEGAQAQGGPGNPKVAIGVSSEGGHVGSGLTPASPYHNSVSLTISYGEPPLEHNPLNTVNLL